MKMKAWHIVALAILGVFGVLLCMMWLDSRNERAQWDTTIRMRKLGGVLDSFKARTGTLPQVLSDPVFQGDCRARGIPPFALDDGWGRPMRYERKQWTNREGATGISYYLASAGSDGKWEKPGPSGYSSKLIDSGEYRADIVYSDGGHVIWPAAWKGDH